MLLLCVVAAVAVVVVAVITMCAKMAVDAVGHVVAVVTVRHELGIEVVTRHVPRKMQRVLSSFIGRVLDRARVATKYERSARNDGNDGGASLAGVRLLCHLSRRAVRGAVVQQPQ